MAIGYMQLYLILEVQKAVSSYVVSVSKVWYLTNELEYQSLQFHINI